jgi:hypothetical protein
MNEPKKTTAQDLVGEMIKDHPELRPNAVAAEIKSSHETPARADGSKPKETETFRDKSREIFDPEKHYSDKFGRPQYTAGGYFRKIPLRKRLKRQAQRALGRPDAEQPDAEQPDAEKAPTPTAEPAPAEEPSAEQPKTETPTEEDPTPRSYIPPTGAEAAAQRPADEYRAAAKAITSTIFTVGISIGGVTCKPLPQHVESMESAYENYFRTKGVKDIPPGLAVALSTGGYCLFCFQSSQQVQKQSKGLFAWIVGKIGAMRTRSAQRRFAKRNETESDRNRES